MNFDNTITFQQLPLNCQTKLTLKASFSSPIVIQYVNGGSDLTYNYLNFFDLNTAYALINCDIIKCEYGDTCGASMAITSTDVTSMATSTPWNLEAKRNVLAGYSANLCIRCTMTNMYILDQAFVIT